MKRFIGIFVSFSLALAATIFGQQPQEQASPGKGQGRKEAHQQQQQQQQTTQQQGGRHQRGQKAAGQQNAAAQNNGTGQQNAAPANVEPTQKTGKRGRRGNAETNAATTNASPATNAETNANATTGGKQARQGKRGHNRAAETTANTGTGAGAAAAGAAATGAAATGAAATNGQTNTAANTQTNVNAGGRGARKLDQQKVQTIKSQHANFRAQPKPDKVPAVTFNQNHRIEGAEQWQGPQYAVFRSYHPEYHDQGWWHSHYNNIQLIGGGYYFFNNGYWYPAWGYNPGAQYYAWDGPIYVGHRAEPPDQVIADVQAALQEEGYYRGEVDGLLGPLTREALAEYQADHNLYRTAAIDEPTLDSLGMS